MSDITKKIFSIEPMDEPNQKLTGREPNTSDIMRPMSVTSSAPQKSVNQEKVPDFVTRDEVKPLASPPNSMMEDAKSGSAWIILTVIGFSLLYVIGVSLFLLPPLIKENGTLFQFGGLAVLLVLPVILLILLGVALKRLANISQQSRRLVRAAEVLVSPETEALSRTQTLANGIQSEILKLNAQLANTVEVLQGVQTAVSKESQALDSAGLQLSDRAGDVGRNLTLQRQALESISGTFDARMATLSTQITETSLELESLCVEAEKRLSSAGSSLAETALQTEKNIGSGTKTIGQKILELGVVSRDLDSTTQALREDLNESTAQLVKMDKNLEQRVADLTLVNQNTQSKISDFQGTIEAGHQLLSDLRASADTRETQVKALYAGLENQLKQAEDDTLASQGQTARVVETNLAQMRRDFGRMETEMHALQAKLNGLRDAADDLPEPEFKPSRLNLKPLESDFPPVEPPRAQLRGPLQVMPETPINLGMDMEIDTPDRTITEFEPDVISRPGQPMAPKKGFGRKTEKETSGWRWRDMLGGLERPDLSSDPVQAPLSAPQQSSIPKRAEPSKTIDISTRLSAIQLSPSAFIDEGLVVDATQARINTGETGLAATVVKQLPEAVAHLRSCMSADTELSADIEQFYANFSMTMGNTPPSAPALRAALGSPNGRAYLLCTAALKG